MASDRDLVSNEDHELNYLLQKWEKKQTKENREILSNCLKEFKSNEDYKPHNRENFYKYIDDKKIKKLLENAVKEVNAIKEVKKSKESKTKGKIKIKLVKSPFGYTKDQISTVRCLGLKKMNQVKEHDDTSVIRGMIFKVKHLVKVL